MSVAADVTRATVGDELALVEQWRLTFSWIVSWVPEHLTLTVRMRRRPASARAGDGTDEYVFLFDLTDYPELPPLITLEHAELAERETKRCYPNDGRGYFMVHNGSPCLCAPWNRRAYGVNAGPHNEWEMRSWQTIHPGHGSLAEILPLLQDLLDNVEYKGRMSA